MFLSSRKEKGWPAAAGLWESNERGPLNTIPPWGGLYINTLSFEPMSLLFVFFSFVLHSKKIGIQKDVRCP